jgi:hypothetical protein
MAGVGVGRRSLRHVRTPGLRPFLGFSDKPQNDPGAQKRYDLNYALAMAVASNRLRPLSQ